MEKKSTPSNSSELRQRAEEELIQRSKVSPLSEMESLRLVHELQVHQIELEMQNEELKQTEASLRQLSLAVEQTSNGVVITDLQGNIQYVNAACAVSSGYDIKELLDKNPSFLQSGTTSRETYEDLWQTLSEGRVWQGEFINRRKNGEFYTEAEIISPVRQADGRITHYIGIKEDITERKRIESARKESEQRFYDIARASADWI